MRPLLFLLPYKFTRVSPACAFTIYDRVSVVIAVVVSTGLWHFVLLSNVHIEIQIDNIRLRETHVLKVRQYQYSPFHDPASTFKDIKVSVKHY